MILQKLRTLKKIVRTLTNLEENIELIKKQICKEVPLRSTKKLTAKLDYGNHDIFLVVNSPKESRRAFACQKEPWTVKWIETFIKREEVLYDIGANVGAYSLLAAKHIENTKVFAFEPSFSNYASLCENVVINNCQESVHPLPIALSDKTGLVTFNYRGIESGMALHTIEGVNKYISYEPVFKQLVLCYTLDDLVKEFNLPVPNHIKLDVDGAEFKVLKGSEKILSEESMVSLMIEVNDEEREKMIEFLEDKSLYTFAEYRKKKSKKGQPIDFSYFIFIRK